MIVPVVGLSITLPDSTLLPVEGLTVTVPDPPPPGGVTPILGTWTPVIGGSGGESGQSYTAQSGHYIRIGPLVYVWAHTQFSALGTINGSLQLKGLPFPTINGAGFFAGACAYSSNLTPNAANLTNILLYASTNASAANLFGMRAGQNPRPLDVSDLNPATQFILSLAYPTDVP
jgi:hypothetical protein